MRRGRSAGQVPALIEQALRDSGLSTSQLQQLADEHAAARALLAWAGSGDVLVLPIHTASIRMALAAMLSQR